MGMLGFIKAKMDVSSGNIKLVRIIDISADLITFSNGIQVKVFDSQIPNLPVGRDAQTGELRFIIIYGESFWGVFDRGVFSGVIVVDIGRKEAVNINTGEKVTDSGFSGIGDINWFLANLVSSDFYKHAKHYSGQYDRK